MPIKPCDEPLCVNAEEGQVIVEGGCGVAITLTPPAAIDTTSNLLEGVSEAVKQSKAEMLADDR